MRGSAGRGKAFLGAVLFVAGCMAFGPIDSALGQLLHPTGSPRPSFEVATIKPDTAVQSRPAFQISPGRFVARHFCLKDLIEFAYHTKAANQIVGGPGWTNTEFFNVEATVEDAATAALKDASAEELTDQFRLMVQSLLADRFQLRVSFRTDALPVYALVVSSGGSSMKEAVENATDSSRHVPMVRLTGPNQFTATDCTMTRMVDWLSHFDEVGNRMVIDETGLKGRYHFVLSGVTMESVSANTSSADETTTSIFTALREQLGLKLEARKATVEILVVEHLERPSQN
jgi:uncharacterized protein (TIGR03435 family)